MEILNFKTDIGCLHCVKAASFFLGDNNQILEWHNYTNHPEILTVNGWLVSRQKKIRELNFAGFNNESIDDVCNTKGSNI